MNRHESRREPASFVLRNGLFHKRPHTRFPGAGAGISVKKTNLILASAFFLVLLANQPKKQTRLEAIYIVNDNHRPATAGWRPKDNARHMHDQGRRRV